MCSSGSISTLRGEPRAEELLAHDRAELGLGQEEEVGLRAAQNAERRDHAGLRREQ